jgi:hypothetical protein
VNKELNAYMGYCSEAGSQEGAILIFAHNSKEARKLGWITMKALYEVPWTTMSTRLLRKNLVMLKKDADQTKLAKGIPHVVDDMAVCPNCELWGEDGVDENGKCGYCPGP